MTEVQTATKPLLSRKAAAERLNVHPDTVRRLVPAVRIGKKILRYRPDDIERIASGQAAGGVR